MHDSGPLAVRIDVPQCAMAPPFAPAANLSMPLSLGLRATPRTMSGGGRSVKGQSRSLAVMFINSANPGDAAEFMLGNATAMRIDY